jgi:hypothetical protein
MTDKQNDSTDIEAWATVVREVLGVPSLSHHSAYIAGTVRPSPSPAILRAFYVGNLPSLKAEIGTCRDPVLSTAYCNRGICSCDKCLGITGRNFSTNSATSKSV